MIPRCSPCRTRRDFPRRRGCELPRPEFRSFAWPEPTNHLALAIDQLGAVFNRLVETNSFQPLPTSGPARGRPDPPRPSSAGNFRGHSVVRLEGDLAQRRLLTPLELRSWTNPDILTNSVVQVVVDAEGRPVSVTLLSGSGSQAADQYALEQARAARFEPLSRNPAGTALSPTAH